MVYNIKFDMYLRNYENCIFLGKITYTTYINAFLFKTHNTVEIMLQKREQASHLKSTKSDETFWQSPVGPNKLCSFNT